MKRIIVLFFLFISIWHTNCMLTIYDNVEGIINRTDRIPTMITLHYTVLNYEDTIQMFSDNVKNDSVLAHYVISEAGVNSDIEKSPVRFAVDTAQVGHAGVSYWNNLTAMNRYAIGIENVNKGFTDTDEGGGIQISGSDKYFYHFNESQVLTIIDLCTELIKSYNISPYNITGHADIAVNNGRKWDPGPLFPWRRLANFGIGLWYNTKLNYPNKSRQTIDNRNKTLFVEKLIEFGFPSPTFVYTNASTIVTTTDPVLIERYTNSLLEIYNMHYRQEKGISRVVDCEDFKIIDFLIYFKNLLFKKPGLKVNWEELYNTNDPNYIYYKNLIW